MGGKETNLQNNLQIWNYVLIKYGMKINTQKRKVMVVSYNKHRLMEWCLSKSTNFSTWGNSIASGSQDADINKRTLKLQEYLISRTNVLIKRKYHRNNIMVFNIICKLVLIYRCESWMLSRETIKIQASEMRY